MYRFSVPPCSNTGPEPKPPLSFRSKARASSAAYICAPLSTATEARLTSPAALTVTVATMSSSVSLPT